MFDVSPLMLGLGIIAAVGFGYILLLRMAVNWAYPHREKMYEIGNRLLVNDRISESSRTFLCHALRNAFSYRGALAWVLAAFALVALALTNRTDTLAHEPQDVPFNDDLNEFTGLYLRSIFAANPIVGTVAAVLTLVALLVTLLIRPTRPADARSAVAHYTALHAPV